MAIEVTLNRARAKSRALEVAYVRHENQSANEWTIDATDS